MIPHGDGSYTFTIRLQSSRNGSDEGGQYTVTVMAQDNAGNKGSASTVVTVPHDHQESEEGEESDNM